MVDPTFLQIFLLINVFLMGAVAAIAARHAYAHFRPARHEPEKTAAKAHSRPAPLPPAVKERLLHQAEDHYQSVLEHAAMELERDLKVTSAGLTKQLQSLGSDIVAQEMKRYRDSLELLRAQAEHAIGGAQADVAAHQAELDALAARRRSELETKLQEEIVAEKDRLLAQIDTKLADAVTSFLMETLQHNVDLGAQSGYLIAMLEEHKAELAAGVKHEA